jgi:hypothetical protein
MSRPTLVDDLLLQLLNAKSPKECQAKELVPLVSKVAAICGESDSDDEWIRLALTLLYKRYHICEPETKPEKPLLWWKGYEYSRPRPSRGIGEWERLGLLHCSGNSFQSSHH